MNAKKNGGANATEFQGPAFPARLPDGVRLDALAPAPANTDDEPVIDFAPVPRRRDRRSGWTEERQRGFIAALARCGCVKAAAAHVGLSPRNVYRLLDMEGADSFAAAWDRAQDIGRARIEADALERALSGAFVPIYRKGRLVRVEYRRCDGLAIALLGGKDQEIADYGRAVRRARYAADLRAYDQQKAKERRAKAEFAQRYEAELKEMVERGRASRQPRVRAL